MRGTTVLAVLATMSAATTAQKCYSMDGQALDSRYQPCFPQAASSGCCMLNGTQGAGQENDICLDSGLCQSTSGWYAGFLYINGCTDPTGKADGCAKLCSFMGNQYSYSVLQCSPGKFCCRAASDTENCCGSNKTMISTSHIGSLILPGSTAVVNTTFNATNPQAPTTSNNPSSNSSSNCLNTGDHQSCPVANTGTIAGALGGILGAALIATLVALIFSLRSRKHYKTHSSELNSKLAVAETQHGDEKAEMQKQMEEQQRYYQKAPPNYPVQTPVSARTDGGHSYTPVSYGHGRPVELSDQRMPSELSDDRVEHVRAAPKS